MPKQLAEQGEAIEVGGGGGGQGRQGSGGIGEALGQKLAPGLGEIEAGFIRQGFAPACEEQGRRPGIPGVCVGSNQGQAFR